MQFFKLVQLHGHRGTGGGKLNFTQDGGFPVKYERGGGVGGDVVYATAADT